jgi:hypothetical protein
MKLQAEKMLVMRYRFIGDTVLTVPFLRNLREAYPEARIDLMLEPFSGQVIEGCPYVDRIIPFEFKTIHKYSAASPRGRLAGYVHYWKMLRQEGYDAAFALKRSLSSALLIRTAGIPRRIGFATEGRTLLLTDPVSGTSSTASGSSTFPCVPMPLSSGRPRRTTQRCVRSFQTPDGRRATSKSSSIPRQAFPQNSGRSIDSPRS